MPAALQPVNSQAGLRACELKHSLELSAVSAAAPSHAYAQWLDALAGSLTVAGAAPDSSCTTVVVELTGFPFQPLDANARSGHLEACAVYLMNRSDALQAWTCRDFSITHVVDPSLLG